ncbi:MAG TPA: TrkA C-terminal domain-containing protein [Thermoanaerobaculia bacterium]|nr:TrkA C-terminal domain-containing protein [Thermoanaerobaculia bacterium]
MARLASRGESSLITLEVAKQSAADGHRIVELDDWPRDALILVLYRGDEFFVPNGGTRLEAGDRLIVLANKATVDDLSRLAQNTLTLDSGGA